MHVTAALEYSVDFETGDLDGVREHKVQARVADIHAANDEREVGDVKDSPAGLSASVFVRTSKTSKLSTRRTRENCDVVARRLRPRPPPAPGSVCR